MSIPPTSERLRAIEGLLFVSPGPLRLSELAEATGWDAKVIEQDLEALAQSLEGHGIELQRVAGALRLVTVPEVAPYIERMVGVQSRRRLTRAQLETLSVVAYRQPVTRAQVEAYRGVSCERLLGQLVDLRLIREVGRAELPGRPHIYGTTVEFLRYFGLNKIEELPDVGELRKTATVGVSHSQASWNQVARGEAAPAETAPLRGFKTMQPIADELSHAPSQGLRKLLDRIRGNKEAAS